MGDKLKIRTKPDRSRRNKVQKPDPAPPLQPTNSALEPPDLEAIALREHVLNRLGYGPTPAQRELFDAIGLEKYIELHVTGQSGNQTLPPMAPWPLSGGAVQGELADAGQPSTIADARDVIIRMFLERGISTVHQLEAVLSDFWLNHFNIFAFMGIPKWQLDTYLNDALAPNLAGSFEAMLIATAKHPAMLQYLDNRKNAKAPGFWRKDTETFHETKPNVNDNELVAVGPNENYAREVMELHTLGVDGGYSQDDVIAAQRILTGWCSNFEGQDSDDFAFHPPMHDTGPKSVMGVAFPQGANPVSGEDEVVQFLRWLANHPKTATRIARKLVVRFLGERASVSAHDAVAKAMLSSGMEIGTGLSAMFAHPEFRSPHNFGTRFKPPHRLALSAIRLLDVVPTQAQLDDLVGELLLLGDTPFYYGPPTGFPDTTAFWLSGSSMLGRFSIARMIAYWPAVENAAFAAIGGKFAETTPEVADALIHLVLPTGVSATTRTQVIQGLGAGSKDRAISRGLEMLFASPEFGRY